MKRKILILFMLFIFIGNIQSQDSFAESIIDEWTAVDQPLQPAHLFLLNQYIWSVKDEDSGFLTISITSQNNERDFNSYVGRIPFSYTILTTDSDQTPMIGVEYGTLEIDIIEARTRNYQSALASDIKLYMEDLKRKISNRYEEYELDFDGVNQLTMKGFSLIENSTFANFSSR